MKAIDLPCGYRLIPYIYDRKENSNLSDQDLSVAKTALEKLQKDRHTIRLSENYKYDRLHLDKMFIYNVLYDVKAKLPVLVSGVQIVGKLSVRVFSRYFVFPEYRTKANVSGLFDKVDNFEVLQNDILSVKEKYPFIFWSRDKGPHFFEKLKNVRPDVFAKWVVHPVNIEVIYKGNHQGIMYLNQGHQDSDYFIKSDLLYKADD